MMTKGANTSEYRKPDGHCCKSYSTSKCRQPITLRHNTAGRRFNMNRTLHGSIVIALLSLLLPFAHGQGERDSVSFEVPELQPAGTIVGTIPVLPDLTYRFSDPSPNQFNLNSDTGVITTSRVLDRDDAEDNFNLLVQSTPAQHLVEVQITITDVNDNSPIFDTPIIYVSFTEGTTIGVQILLDTATDRDIGENDVTTNYHIVSGNEDDTFELLVLTDTQEPLLYLQSVKNLDREVRGGYLLNISAQDGGQPPRYGYLTVNITVIDVNDNQPVFGESDYYATVNETVPAGTFIIEMVATDEDINDNGLIHYSIFNDGQNQFGIDPQTGVVRTLKQLQCHRVCSNDESEQTCFPKSCVVIVEAVDSGKPFSQRGRAYVTVILLDENDHDPVIQFQYISGTDHATVMENAANYSLVAVVSVTDADDGLNGQTTSTITAGNEESNFVLSGRFIRTNGRLDRERVANYNLTIEARDMGVPQRSVVGYLVVEVSDINDHEPRFDQEQYGNTLRESVPIGTFVSSVTATDDDSGINAIIHYTIISGNDLGWFLLNADTGLVTTVELLDYERSSTITIVIQAEDGGSPPHSTTVNLIVDITDENDEGPRFVENSLTFGIDENTNGNQLVTRLSAIDADQGENGLVSYRFAEDTFYYSYFNLNSRTGELTLTTSLDREEVNMIQLEVIATDQAVNPLSSTVAINIYVRDHNDNPPIFYPDEYFIRVSENQPIYTPIAQVLATDADIGSYGTITYAIIAGDSQKFEIAPENGWISVVDALQKGEQYSMTIAATDQDDTLTHTATCTVDITVTDLIDIPMPFNQDSYEFSIVEGSRVSRFVGQVQSIASGVTYKIINGDPGTVFSINNNGIINTLREIDRETHAVYSLTVATFRAELYGEVLVTIIIDDLNDYQPDFGRSFIDTKVAEDAPIGHGVYSAHAVDLDEGDNGRLTYRITEGSTDYFHLDTNTGLISVAQSLLTINTLVISFTIQVIDSGSTALSSQLDVTINIEDVNNHTPTFTSVTSEISVPESTSVNHQFFNVAATDADLNANGELQYSITSGNINDDFGIFPDGSLYIAHSLDRESRNAYVLTIVVHDNGEVQRSSDTVVIVHVLDANDNKPHFTNSSYNMLLMENSPPQSFVGIIHASDPDIGRNAEVTYHMDSTDFSIDPSSGVLRSITTFDREAVKEATGHYYVSVYVTAKDNGDIQQSTRTLVLIHLVDDNDNAPIFEREVYEQSILENAEIGTSIATLTAVDVDNGDNAEVTYSIVEGNNDNIFFIDSRTGQLVKNGDLDREEQDRYTIMVMAFDHGDVPLNSTSLVTIAVLDANDNNPVFTESTSSLALAETTQSGVFLFKFTAIDDDLGNNADISYHITNGNIGNTFHIDSITGRLYLNSTVDYERRQLYTLDIIAQDNGQPRLHTTTVCYINVIDANDRAPEFDSAALVREIPEDIQVGSSVITMTATDGDSGVNAEIVYLISRQDPPSGRFQIDPTSGVIRTTVPLDYELIQEYIITVVATDQAEDIEQRKQGEKVVLIRVRDVNDNYPMFSSMSAVAVSDHSSSSVITTVVAIDADEGDDVYYTIVESNDEFNIGRLNGRLTVSSTLLSGTIYELKVQAEDNGGHISMMNMQVFTVPPQEGGPQFSQRDYSARIEENQSGGASLITVSRTNSEYFVTGTNAIGSQDQKLYFTVDRNSGEVSTTRLLDREAGDDVFNVEIYAVEMGSRNPTARKTQIRVTLTDVNDNPPVFTSSVYDIDVPESRDPGQEVAMVTATDADAIHEIVYHMEDSDVFSLDPTTGRLLLLQYLDREDHPRHTLQISAFDGIHTTEATININVGDVNDETPTFLVDCYSFDIMEDALAGTTIGRISAEDRDLGSSGEVRYQIISTWGRENFALHQTRGVFTLVGTMDFEQDEQFVLTVRAHDNGGSSSRSSTVSVYMNIRDTNDNAPIFDPSSYSNQVWENVTVGNDIITVSATDLDTGSNGRVVYSIVGGNDRRHFAINSITGTVHVARTLDRETQASYNLAVMAKDQPETGRSYSTTAMVTIILRDSNDNAPQFLRQGPVSVVENAPTGTSIYTFETSDADEGMAGDVFYRLEGSSSFSIDSLSGVLRSQRQFDRENPPSDDDLHVTVVATDRGDPARSSNLDIQVDIRDANDNDPVFLPAPSIRPIREDTTIGTSLLTLSATDSDIGLNGAVRFVIIDGDDNEDFRIDSHLGHLYVQKRLDYERKQSYTLGIQARDMGTPVRADSITIQIDITDVNDITPRFVDAPYVAWVREGITDLPVHVLDLLAEDGDSGRNARIIYSIMDGAQGIFSLSNGRLTATRTLDREQTDQYQLVIQAADMGSGNSRKSSTTMVTVLVEDVNDHNPVFQQTHYTARITENNDVITGSEDAIPEVIIRVNAQDQDQGSNAQITYSLEDLYTNGATDVFQINPFTGEIHCLQVLDRETNDVYELIVRARDSGLVPRSSSALVTITVTDDNDNAPQFSQNNYRPYVRDTTSEGDFVLGVTAVDQDIGVNGQVTYELAGSSSVRSNFEIDGRTGVITARNRLSQQRYSFTVRASDGGANSQSDEAQVEINLHSRASSSFPEFLGDASPTPYVVSEQSAIGHQVMTVQASQNTPGTSILYYIAGGNIDNAFALSSEEGVLQTTGRLDYEHTSDYTLWLEARVTGTPPQASYRRITVRVVDENDNVPVFQQGFYNTTIMEGDDFVDPVQVTIVSATDLDSGANGRIQYSFSEETRADVANAFHMNSQSGEIRCMQNLDREVRDAYILLVLASDQGSPALTATAVVQVSVGDRNDKPPLFTQHFITHVPENVPIGFTVLKITSTDADIGENAVATYSLISDPNENFAVDPDTGAVTVIKPLDYEIGREYILRVRANDGAYNAETAITIDIGDTNDCAPIFEQPNYQFDLVEGLEIGSEVGSVSASDLDAAGANSELFYTWREPSSTLMLHTDTGVITTLQDVNYQQADSIIHMQAVATDRGEPPLSSEVTVIVNIHPTNLYDPVFEQTSYQAYVTDNSETGTHILTLHATDSDFNSPTITYTIEGGSGRSLMSLHPETGELSLDRRVGGHTGLDYSVTVRATDHGTPRRSSSATVRLNIVQENQNAPVFQSGQSFIESVAENAAPNHVIATIRASDADRDAVRYYITDGNDAGLFEMQQDQGQLRLAAMLDYESNTEHRLMITARDGHPIPREVSRLFTVIVLDVNDNAPLFDSDNYDVDVQENTPVDTSIFLLQTTDLDVEQNVHYHITGNRQAINVFTVEQQSGVIKCQRQLDYETEQLYELVIKAFNPNTDLSSSTTVRVHVTSANEFIPQCSLEEYRFTVSESAAPGSVAGTVRATDADEGIHGIPMFFFIGNSNSRGFSINPNTGIITMSGRVDRESSSSISLDVLVKNQGPASCNNTAVCHVSVIVSDANDPPTFTESLYMAEVPENSGPSQSIMRVAAEDQDAEENNQNFFYRILDPSAINVFRVHQETGVISTLGMLDREAVDLYTFVISAVDNGRPPQTGTATVQIRVTDMNDMAPYFTVSPAIRNVTEQRSPNTEVVANLNNMVTDDDLVPNGGPFIYQLLDHRELFTVGSTSGLVQASVVLDREDVPEYELTLQVTDNGSPTMTSTLTLTVHVKDVNDSPSRARNMDIKLYVYNGIFEGGIIADVKPEDDDIAGDYSCSISSGRSSYSIRTSCDLTAGSLSSGHPHEVLRIQGSDGVHAAVDYAANVSLHEFTSQTIQSSVVLRLTGVLVEDFLANLYEDFLSALSSVARDSHADAQVVLYSMYSVGDTTHLLVAVTDGDGYMSRGRLIQLITEVKVDLQRYGVFISDVDYEPCVGNPCMHLGTCSQQIQVLSNETSIVDSPALIFTSHNVKQIVICECTEEYTGTLCEVPRNQCRLNPCHNNGICIQDPGPSGYRCECGSHWKGTTCDEDVDECSPINPCRNEAQCQNTRGSFTCRCPVQYSGDLCEYERNFCAGRPCENGAECRQAAGAPDYECICQPGDRGRNCGVLSYSFEPMSYIEYDVTMNEQQHNSIHMEFRTYMSNALLLFLTSGQGSHMTSAQEYIAIEVVDGSVRFSFLVQGSQPVRVTVSTRVDTGDWFHLEAVRSQGRGELKVSACETGSDSCETCRTDDQSCYASENVMQTGLLDNRFVHVSVGGVSSITPLLEHTGWVETHDFAGCMRQVIVDTVQLFAHDSDSQSNVSDHCTITDQEALCLNNPCLNNGRCMPEHQNYRCYCAENYMGLNCEKDKEPLSFGPNSQVIYKQRKSYTRDQLLLNSGSNRRKRSELSSKRTISMRFRTSKDQGMLFSSSAADDVTVLQILSGKVEYHSKQSLRFTAVKHDSLVNDGEWHNVSLIIEGSTVVLSIDDVSKQQTAMNNIHDLLGLDVTKLTVGGEIDVQLQNTQTATGFSGCLSELLVDGLEMPFIGSTDRFDIEVIGDVSNSCSGLADGGGSLHAAIIVIIVFFVVVLIVIVIVFIVLRWRRKQRKEAEQHLKNLTAGNSNGFINSNNKSGSNSLDKSNPDQSLRKPDGSHYTDDENDFRQLAENAPPGRYQEREVKERPVQLSMNHPDIIAAEPASSVQLADGTVITEDRLLNGHLAHLGHENMGYQYDMPAEHYDIENASSIAPSDMDDVVGHYKRYRTNGLNGTKYPITPNGMVHPPNHKHPHRRVSPSPITQLDFQNRHLLGMRPMSQSPIARNSPALVTSSPLTIQNVHMLSRKSPTAMHPHYGARPVSALGVRDKRESPLPHGMRSLGTTPVNHIYEPGSNASSNESYIKRPASVPVGGAGRPPKHSRLKQSHPPPAGLQFGANHRVNVNHGLTVEDVHLMNAVRTTSPSTLDAVSSSSDGRHIYRPPRVNNGTAYQYEQSNQAQLAAAAAGLEPGDSSSDEAGSNDSFTCSEFEYEPERTRGSGTKSSFGQLAEVAENDSELSEAYRSLSRAAGDGSDSNRDAGSLSTFPTSDEDQQQNRSHLLNRPQSAASRLLNGTALNWDYLLNWGPNFEKLVGVFNDIAELPDEKAASAMRQSNSQMSSPINLSGNTLAKSPTASISFESNVREEYV